MSDVGNDCPECDRRLRGPKCACGWAIPSAPAPEKKPPLEMYRERPDVRATFQGCEHVKAGVVEPCPPCAAKIAVLRRQFLDAGRTIERRMVQL